MESFDLIVIGSGPGGERAATSAAFFGKRVALVEKDRDLGGASTNTGTIPSKTFRETALALSGLRARGLYGVDLSLRRDATIRDFTYHETRVKTSERERVATALERVHVERFQGFGSFVDPHTIAVTKGSSGDVTIRGDYIVIATGSSPVQPAIFPFDSPRVHDSDEVLALDHLPSSLAVVGAGVIGAEYACTFAAMGTKVTVLDGRNELLPFLDREISAALERAMRRLGIEFRWNTKVTACEPDENKVRMICEGGDPIETEGVLVAAGRKSNTEKLGLPNAGITPGPKGLIVVDSAFRTSVPHIFAVGDVVGFPALAATSAEQGRLAVCYAFGMPFKADLAQLLPTGIYTIPEVSMIGATEEELQAKKEDYIAGRAWYSENARGKIIGDQEGFLKLLFRRSDLKLLGVHVIGEHASEIVHTGMMAMLTGSGASLFNNACFNYPTLGDLYKQATYDAFGRAWSTRDQTAG